MRIPKVGQSWGHLQLIDIEREPVEYKHNGVTETRQEDFLVMRCDCGHLYRLAARQWTGKSQHRDCGCGIAARESSRSMSFVADQATQDRIKKYAKFAKVTTSRGILEVVLFGLEAAEELYSRQL